MHSPIPHRPSRSSLLELQLAPVYFWGSGILLLLTLMLPGTRYLSYAIPLLGVLVLLANGRSTPLPALQPLLALLLCAPPLMALLEVRFYGLQDMYLILIGLMPLLVAQQTVSPLPLERLCLILVAGFLLASLRGYLLGDMDAVAVDVFKSTSPLESGFSFLFGLLAVVAFMDRRYRIFALMLLLTLLSLKRIALLGILVCVMVWWFPPRWKQRLLSPFCLCLANLLFIYGVLSFVLGTYDRLIHEWTGLSANAFAMGRRTLYYYPALQIQQHLAEFMFVGQGPGAIYSATQWGLAAAAKSNAHSDILKILYEFGGLVLMLFIWLMYRFKSLRIRLLWLYTNILYLTDNTLIYPFYIFMLGLMIMHVTRQEQAALPVAVPQRERAHAR